MSPSSASQPAKIGMLVNIDVDDLERGTRFYTEAFDLRVGRRFTERWIELLGGSSPIYLLEKKGGSVPAPGVASPRSYERHWTPVHMDFVVDSIERVVAQAERAGARVESAIADQPYGRIAMLADPFGHGFCVIEFNREGYDAPGI